MKNVIYEYPCEHCHKRCILRSKPREGIIFHCDFCKLNTRIGKFYLTSGKVVLNYEPRDQG